MRNVNDTVDAPGLPACKPADDLKGNMPVKPARQIAAAKRKAKIKAATKALRARGVCRRLARAVAKRIAAAP